MKKDKWVWMPHAGHFIGGSKCMFHLNTYVGKYIVSTIGEYRPDGNEMEFADLGIGRKYETMVFTASKSTKNKCCPYVAKAWSELDMSGYNTAGAAYRGHLKLCTKWSKK